MSNIGRIQSLSRILSVTSLLLIAAIPIAIGWVWLRYPLSHGGLGGLALLPGNLPLDGPLGSWQRVLCFSVAMIPGGWMIYGLLQVRTLGRHLSAGHLFETKSVRTIRKLAVAFIGYGFALFFADILQTVVFTAGNEPGHRILGVGITPRNIAPFVVGGIVFLLAHVMAEAHRLNEDHRQIV